MNLVYWDDTTLVVTSVAIMKAVEKIRMLFDESRLLLKLKKCHLYGLAKVVSKCKKLSTWLAPVAKSSHRI